MRSLGIRTVDIADIQIGTRLREIDPAWVEALAALMENDGQLQPISVALIDDTYHLIDGIHRVAARSAGTDATIRAEIFEPETDDPAAEMMLGEVDTTLLRPDLTALERSIFLAKRKDVYEALHPQTKHGAQGGRGGRKNETDILSFSKETAKRLGLDERSVRRAVSIAFQIPDDVKRKIRGTRVADNQAQLLQLAEQDERTQRRAVDLLTKGEAKDVKKAVAQATGNAEPEPSREDQFYEKFRELWRNAPKGARRRIIDFLQETGDLED